MLQLSDYERELERELNAILSEIPGLTVTRKPGSSAASGPDLTLNLKTGGTRWTLVCEFKQNAQPRHVRSAVYQLRHYLDAIPGSHKYAVLVGPYISPDSAELLKSESMGFADLAGNCRLSFATVYIERTGIRNPFTATRKHRSLFSPKSARALTVLLDDPHRWWKTTDLATSAHVSAGHISNIKKALLDREWARTNDGQFRIDRPDAVLDAWRGAYEKRERRQLRYHTPLHGEALDNAVRMALEEVGSGKRAVLSSYSAARWMAPFARTSNTYFYADSMGEDVLRKKLQLESVARGENVVIETPRDEGVFALRVEVAPGIWATHPIQTYLDLSASGERGAEAAEHLRSTKIAPTWKPVA